jgi:hypothetical protein
MRCHGPGCEGSPHDIDHRHFTWSGGARACDRGCLAAVPIPDNQREYDIQHGLVEIVAHTMTITCGRLELIERELASATSKSRDTERIVAALLSRRDELCGLFDAYKAKAARLGATEDPSLAARYDQARELLWTAPCDLNAAADAVDRFQQAVLAIGAQRL